MLGNLIRRRFFFYIFIPLFCMLIATGMGLRLEFPSFFRYLWVLPLALDALSMFYVLSGASGIAAASWIALASVFFTNSKRFIVFAPLLSDASLWQGKLIEMIFFASWHALANWLIPALVARYSRKTL